MAKDDKTEEDEAEAGGGKKKLIIGAVVALVGLGAVYNFVLKPAPEPEPIAMVDPEPVEGEIIELPEMVINLDDPQVSYLRVGIALILEEGTLAADFEGEAAIAKDVILSDLSSRSADQLSSAEGKQRVKEELSIKVRDAYDDAKVVRVLFTVFVMQ